MDIILTKNSIDQLSVFFARKNLNNISRPHISYIKIDSASRTEPVYHLGFEENMGFIDSYKVSGGVMVFEVLEGYPLQDLLFYYNMSKKSEVGYKYSLEDLPAMDFYCVQKQNQDIYGDFILKNFKFISTKMDQGVNNYSRKIIAEFVCSDVIPLRIPYFFNNFVSDNYNYHIVRNRKEIEQIKQDIDEFESEGYLTDQLNDRLAYILKPAEKESEYNFDTSEYVVSLTRVLDETFQQSIYDFLNKRQGAGSAIMRIQQFIKEFYKHKNEKGIEKLRSQHNLGLFSYKDLLGEDFIDRMMSK